MNIGFSGKDKGVDAPLHCGVKDMKGLPKVGSYPSTKKVIGMGLLVESEFSYYSGRQQRTQQCDGEYRVLECSGKMRKCSFVQAPSQQSGVCQSLDMKKVT